MDEILRVEFTIVDAYRSDSQHIRDIKGILRALFPEIWTLAAGHRIKNGDLNTRLIFRVPNTLENADLIHRFQSILSWRTETWLKTSLEDKP